VRWRRNETFLCRRTLEIPVGNAIWEACAGLLRVAYRHPSRSAHNARTSSGAASNEFGKYDFRKSVDFISGYSCHFISDIQVRDVAT
jgi:hypothetical protein